MSDRPLPKDLAALKGKGPKVYSKDFTKKICNCAIHQGVLVPVEEFWGFRSGARTGKLLSECITGMRIARGIDPVTSGYMKYSRVRFIFLELEFRVGRMEASRRMGISSSFWHRHEGNVQKRERTNVRKATVRKAVELLRELRASEVARHRDSIRHGAAARGRKEKKPSSNANYNGRDDSDVFRNRASRRRLRTAK